MGERKKRIPFLPLRPESIEGVVERMLWVGDAFKNLAMDMDAHLMELGYDIDGRKWIAYGMFSSLFYLLLLFASLFSLSLMARVPMGEGLTLSLTLSSMVFFFVLFSTMVYPKYMFLKKSKEIEKNLSYAINHMLIDARSGIPLYDSMVNISKENYGEVSNFMKRVVEEMKTGTSEVKALEKVSRDIKSKNFRRIIWQLTNSLRSGAEIGDVLSEISDSIAESQKISLKKYGSQLNPITLMYMLFSVIFPTLGSTFILILSSFLSINIDIKFIFIFILFFVAFFQFMIITIVKSRRPVGI